MFAVVQFPIADARCFAGDTRLRLELPKFPRPVTWGHPEFVRCFGPTVDRKEVGEVAYTDEVAYCKADKALRFVDFHTQRLGPIPTQILPCGAFRRLFCDGQALSRVEVAVSEPNSRVPFSGLKGNQCLSIARDFLSLPTKAAVFRYPKNADPPPIRYSVTDALVRQGDRLAKIYCRATTSESREDLLDRQESLVNDGRPTAIIEFANEEAVELPAQARAVDPAKVRGASLAFAWLETAGGLIGTWFIRPGAASLQDIRSLRSCLLRLHAEREVLDQLINQIRSGRIVLDAKTEATRSLEAYLNEFTRAVQRPERYGVAQSTIVEAFDAAQEVIPTAYQKALIEGFEGARKQVWRKVEEYEKARGESRIVPAITNNYIGGDYIMENRPLNTGSTYNVSATGSQIGPSARTPLALSPARSSRQGQARSTSRRSKTPSVSSEPP